MTHDHRSRAAGSNDPGIGSGPCVLELLSEATDQSVYSSRVAVEESAPDRVRGVGGYGPRWLLFEVHVLQFGRPGDERVQSDVEPGQNGATQVVRVRVDGADGRRRSDVHDDRREPVVTYH